MKFEPYPLVVVVMVTLGLFDSLKAHDIYSNVSSDISQVNNVRSLWIEGGSKGLYIWKNRDVSRKIEVIKALFYETDEDFLSRTWQELAEISNPHVNTCEFQAAMSENGRAVIIWVSDNEESVQNQIVYVSSYHAGQWSDPYVLSRSEQKLPQDLQVSINSFGSVLASWRYIDDDLEERGVASAWYKESEGWGCQFSLPFVSHCTRGRFCSLSEDFNSFVDEEIHHEFLEPIYALAKAVEEKRVQEPFTLLQNFWRQSSLYSKHWFVHAFNQDHAQFQLVRKALASVIYRPIDPIVLSSKQVQWLTEREIADQIFSQEERTKVLSSAAFFHATSIIALEDILKAGWLEVRHQGVYPGAFVSTRPEIAYGRFILAFKRHIERLSPVEHGFTVRDNYWAGFSRDIPVTKDTLACIILNSASDDERRVLEEKCRAWLGGKINVILIADARHYLRQIDRLGMGIPREWPENSKQKARKILKAMELATNNW